MNPKLSCYLNAIDLCTPALLNWESAQPILTNHQAYHFTHEAIPLADILSAREKRRASHTVNLSLHLAKNLQQQTGIAAELLPTVFATSDGDSDIFDYLSKELSLPQPAVSPTLFHQSLHNSAAGYWGIATHSHQPSLSISAGDYTFAAGLLSATCECVNTEKTTLLIAYNLPAPSPMDVAYPMLTWFGMGFGLSSTKDAQAFAKISIELVIRQEARQLTNSTLALLYQGNPIAHCLPLLEQLALGQIGEIYLDYLSPYSLKISLEEYY